MKTLRCLFQRGLALSLKYPYFFEEVTYWFERNFCLSTCLLHGLTSGQEESRRKRKKEGFSHPYATLHKKHVVSASEN